MTQTENHGEYYFVDRLEVEFVRKEGEDRLVLDDFE